MSSDTSKFSTSDVRHVAALSNLTVDPSAEDKFAGQFEETLEYIDIINKIDTSDITPTHHVTGLENITREDKLTPERTLSQEQALSQSTKTHQGYFVVSAVIANNE